MNPGKSGLVDLNALVRDADDLDPLPASAMRLAGLVTDDDWDLGAIAEIIRLDQALTGRLLGAANSAMSGARRTIDSVEQAVMRLGPGTVLALAIGSAVKGEMQRALPEYGLSEGVLWRHAVAAALAADLARHHCKMPISTEAFAAALLHDIGKLLLARHLEPEAITFLQRAAEEAGLSSEEAEVEVLRVGHAELGALVARRWGLPETICVAIQYHHRPVLCADETGRRLSLQVALADAVAIEIGEVCGDGHSAPTFTPALASALGISVMGFEALCEDARTHLDHVLEAYV